MRGETAQGSQLALRDVYPQTGLNVGWEQLPACISEVLAVGWLLCVCLQLRNDQVLKLLST